jgi:hypothetical protein
MGGTLMRNIIAPMSRAVQTAQRVVERKNHQRRIPIVTRGRVLQWLRTTHVWLGLWGAVLGFIFGLSGLLLNHRAVMKIPVERAQVTQTQATLTQAMTTPDELAQWLAAHANLPGVRANIRKERAATVVWRGQITPQAERWSVTLNTPKVSVSAKYVPGSQVVELETQDATAWGLLLRLHSGSGASPLWILIADTIAGVFMVLTLTGVLLWSRLRAPRLLGVAVLIAAPIITVAYLASM